MGRKAKGRRKTEMVKIVKAANLQVTFTKRKAGIFKKANEMDVQCGSETAIVIFSPGDKVFSYGNPDAEKIIQRYASGSDPDQFKSNMEIFQDALHSSNVEELIQELEKVNLELEAEKKYGEELARRKEANEGCSKWCQAPLEQLTLEEMQKMYACLANVRYQINHTESMITQNIQGQSSWFAPSSSRTR